LLFQCRLVALNEIADNYGENETASKPLPPIDIDPL
jgi:hypothetical protein